MSTLKLPMTRVVLMEDRAQIEHRGEILLSGGLQRFLLPDLPAVAVDRSLRVEVQGATFIDASIERRWKEKPRGGLPADASALRRQVNELDREQRAQLDHVSCLELRAELLSATRVDLLRAIAENTGHGKADPGIWRDQLDVVSTKQTEVDEALRAARQNCQQTQERQAQAALALATVEEKERDIECLLALSLDGQGPAQVRVSYLVPCAMWRPSYRACLLGDRVKVEAEAVVWQHTGQDWKDVALQFSTARPTLGTNPPTLTEDRLHIRPKTQQEKQVVDVTVREQAISSVGEGGGETEMPGLDDGGEARLLAGPEQAQIQSDGQPHRVPLFVFEAPAQLECLCPATLTPLVFLVARFANTSGQVLLAGPVDLVRQSGFVGRSQLKFAALGETVKLSFGGEDGLRVVRTVEEKTEEARLTGRRTVTTTVALHVSNARPDPAKLVLEERVPVSEVKDVAVQVLDKRCTPRPAEVSQEGIVRIPMDLAAHGTGTATFVWELSAAAKVAGV
jgi:uncharacterized protein (TIGR02231 family)